MSETQLLCSVTGELKVEKGVRREVQFTVWPINPTRSTQLRSVLPQDGKEKQFHLAHRKTECCRDENPLQFWESEGGWINKHSIFPGFSFF